jgi:hypothetical protein
MTLTPFQPSGDSDPLTYLWDDPDPYTYLCDDPDPHSYLWDDPDPIPTCGMTLTPTPTCGMTLTATMPVWHTSHLFSLRSVLLSFAICSGGTGPEHKGWKSSYL